MVSELEAEMNQDRYNMAQISDINLDNGSTSPNVNLNGYAIKDLYSDFILVDLIDVVNGTQRVVKNGIELQLTDTSTKSWRKGRVVMVSPLALQYGKTKVGDIVTFENTKGLIVGRVDYVNDSGDVVEIKNGIFLNEQRILAKLAETEEE